MTREEAKIFLYSIAEDLGCTDVENYTCKDGEKMREAIQALKQEPCEDCISRQAVLDAIDAAAWAFCDYLIRNGRNDEQKPVSLFVDNLREYVREELPPVTPQEPCEDAISRQAVFDALEKVAGFFPWRVPGKIDTYDSYNGTWNDAIGRAEMEIEGLPPVNPQRTGHWIKDDITERSKSAYKHKCDRCGAYHRAMYDYCPSCGIKMVEPQESEAQA